MGSLPRVSSFVSPFPGLKSFISLRVERQLSWGCVSHTGSLAEEYNLEQQYRKPFLDVWKEEKDSRVFGPLSERMGVRGPNGGELLVSDEEMEAASKCLCLSFCLFFRLDGCVETQGTRDADSIGLGFYHAFCFYKV